MKNFICFVVFILGVLCLAVGCFMIYNKHQAAQPPDQIAKVLTIPHETTMPVTITVYNATVGQCDNTPFGTADGSVIRPKHPQRWCGLSRDLLKLFPYGSKINIRIPLAPYLDGEWIVHDTGKRSSRNHVDLLISNPDVCYIRGKWEGEIVL